MTDEKLIPGVHGLPEPCYTIIVVGSLDGPDFEGGFSHYIGEAVAAEALTELQRDADDREDTRVFEIRPEEFHCVQAVSLCGRLFVYEGDVDQSHFVDRQNLIDSMEVFGDDPGWQVTPDGAVLCDDAVCRTCRAEIDVDPLLVPVPPVAGQQPLTVPTLLAEENQP
jgi:hypothetical protein